jgi:hypothetical protein
VSSARTTARRDCWRGSSRSSTAWCRRSALKPLSFKAPTPEAERLFVSSLAESRVRYRTLLDAVADRRLSFANTDFDAGQRSAHGEYELADETYADLLHRLAKRKFEGIPDALARNLLAYYDAAPQRVSGKKEARRMRKINERLASLRCSTRANAGCP